MRIQTIGNYNTYKAKNFRLPVKELDFSQPSNHLLFPTVKVNMVKEYKNPLAEMFYKKAQQTKDLFEKTKLIEQMGEYRIIDLDEEAKIKKFVERIIP